MITIHLWQVFRSDGVTPATQEELPLIRATQQGELVREEEFALGGDDGTKLPILCAAAVPTCLAKACACFVI